MRALDEREVVVPGTLDLTAEGVVGTRWPLGGSQCLRPLDGVFDRPLSRGELALEIFLPRDRRDGVIDPEHLMIARDDLPRATRTAVVEENEVLDEIEQSGRLQHAVEECLRVEASLLSLVDPFPLDEMIPFASD